MANNNVFFSKGIDYINMTDEQLIKLEKKHDEVATDVLIERYRDIVNAKVSKYYIAGAEKDDIIQEGLIGLFKAYCLAAYLEDCRHHAPTQPQGEGN